MAGKVHSCSPLHCAVTLAEKLSVAFPKWEQPGATKLPQVPGSGTPMPAPATTLVMAEPVGQVSVPVVPLINAPAAQVREKAELRGTCAAGRHVACAKNALENPLQ